MDKSTKRTLIISASAVGAVALSVVAWWLWITFRGRKKSTTYTMNQNQTNTSTGSTTPSIAGKTASGLVAYCRAQLGRPYWYGTFGQRGSESLYQYKKKQYPAYYTASNYASQYGQKVHDCVGLVKGYFLCSGPDDTNPTYLGNGFPDVSANGLLSYSQEKGLVAVDFPDIPGVAVFMPGHVGVYIGNGQVIEAMNHSRGVVQTSLKGRPWVSWAKIPGLKY